MRVMVLALPFVVTVFAARTLASRRSLLSGLALLAFYAPQAALVGWIAAGLSDRLPAPLALAVTGVLFGALGLVLLHRLLTYTVPGPPANGDPGWFVAVHTTVQGVLLFWLLTWPLSRLLSPSLAVDAAALLGPIVLSSATLAFTRARASQVQVDGLLRPVRVVQLACRPRSRS